MMVGSPRMVGIWPFLTGRHHSLTGRVDTEFSLMAKLGELGLAFLEMSAKYKGEVA